MKYKLCIIVSSSFLFGCSTFNKSALLEPSKKLSIEASSKSQLISANSAEQYNELGRRYQKNGNYSMAGLAYQKALQLSPDNVSSIAGLASNYAQQNMLSVAIPLFEKAVNLNPSAKAYNNLGYAYYLNQQYAEANRVLKQAILLDSDYAQAKNNLALVEANLTADKHLKQLADTQKQVDYVVVNSSTAVQVDNGLATMDNMTAKPTNEIINTVVGAEYKAPVTLAIVSETTAQQQTLNIVTNDMPIAKIQQTASGIYELNFDKNIAEPTTTNVAELDNKSTTEKNNKQLINEQKQLFATVSGGITFKHIPVVSKLFNLATTGLVAMQLSDQHPYMEVINGNGLKGIARAVAGQLKVRGVENIKVADAKRFNLTRTHVQYRTGYRDDALTLTEHLINRPYLVRNDQMPSNVSVRLVLGRDLMKNMRKAEIASINHATDINADTASI